MTEASSSSTTSHSSAVQFPKVDGNKKLVQDAMTAAFVNRDVTAFDRYWAEDYIQHNHFIPPYRDGLRSYVTQLPPSLKYEHGMILGDGDYVMVHSRYAGVQPKALIGFDIFRVANGKVQEHWDALIPEMEPSETLAGNRMFSGPL